MNWIYASGHSYASISESPFTNCFLFSLDFKYLDLAIGKA